MLNIGLDAAEIDIAIFRGDDFEKSLRLATIGGQPADPAGFSVTATLRGIQTNVEWAMGASFDGSSLLLEMPNTLTAQIEDHNRYSLTFVRDADGYRETVAIGSILVRDPRESRGRPLPLIGDTIDEITVRSLPVFGQTPVADATFTLLETGDRLLLEDGAALLMET